MLANMGSLEIIGQVKTPYTGNGPQKFIRKFRGFKADFSKLPTDDNQATGSTAFFLDTSECAEYHAPTKKWYVVSVGGGSSPSDPSMPEEVATDEEFKTALGIP